MISVNGTGNITSPTAAMRCLPERDLMSGFPVELSIPADSGYRENDKWIWCGSAVEEPGRGFHLYASRWRKDYPMLEGYVLFSEIVHAFSPDIAGPYHFVGKVLPSSADPHWDSRMAHNPAIVRWKDEYLLYYIASTYSKEPTPPDLIKSDTTMWLEVYGEIRIGLARSTSPGGPWKVCPHPVLEARKDNFDNTIVTNPAPCVLPDGRIYLYYRTNTPAGARIGLAIYDDPEGSAIRFDSPVLETEFQIEDPFVWHNGEQFEMIAKDLTGKSTGEYHSGAHFISDDGICWKCTGKAYSRQVTTADGSKITLGSLERPQLIFGADGTPEALFAAVADGPGGFSKAENTWNQVFLLK